MFFLLVSSKLYFFNFKSIYLGNFPSVVNQNVEELKAHAHAEIWVSTSFLLVVVSVVTFAPCFN